MSTGNSESIQRLTAALMAGVIGVAVAGYFVGIGAGVPREQFDEIAAQALDDPIADSVDHDRSTELTAAGTRETNGTGAIPAASYLEMRQTESRANQLSESQLQRIHSGQEFQQCINCHNPHTAAVSPNHQHKLQSLAIRASRRAYNGAPPVIPHAVEQTNDAACYVCHGEGAVVGQRIANRMSHGPLANCVQCHAASTPPPFADPEQPGPSNSFVGLPAPVSAERAFEGAPPVIPHSTWMRERCLSCHGGQVGWPGLEVTHRWRTNCVQCHPTSPALEQAVASEDPHARFFELASH